MFVVGDETSSPQSSSSFSSGRFEVLIAGGAKMLVWEIGRPGTSVVGLVVLIGFVASREELETKDGCGAGFFTSVDCALSLGPFGLASFQLKFAIGPCVTGFDYPETDALIELFLRTLESEGVLEVDRLRTSP